MNFIIILVSLLLDQIMRWFEHLRLHPWYEAPLARWAGAARTASTPAQALAAHKTRGFKYPQVLRDGLAGEAGGRGRVAGSSGSPGA